jgi:Zn-dependent metalloprotease
MVDGIARKGNEKQREFALRTSQLDQSFRGARSAPRQSMRTLRTILQQWQSARRRPWLAGVAAGQKERSVFDANNTQRLPGTKVRGEGDPATGDVAVNEAYDGLGATFDLFWEEYERNSIDDNGLPLNATVHYGESYDNAFWNGSQMVFGDGDEDLPVEDRLFNRFTIAIDVIGHELTHGVTENEAGLIYWGQSGALNESVSDVFGSLVKQYVDGQTADQADWLIGEGLFTENVNGSAIRSMKAPGTAYDDPVLGKDPQPDHMSDYVDTVSDNGGVHINSGIPNRAFYLASVNIGGNAWDTTGLVWYETLINPRLRRFAQFRIFAYRTIRTAALLFGSGSVEHEAIRAAWVEVGVIS